MDRMSQEPIRISDDVEGWEEDDALKDEGEEARVVREPVEVFEESFLNRYIPENFPNLTPIQVAAIQFVCVEDAVKFYRYYGWNTGFSIRLDKIRRSEGKDGDRRVISRTVVCNKQGKRLPQWLQKKNRSKAPQPETRCFCLAGCKIAYKKDTNFYHIVQFNAEHNHELFPKAFAHLFRSSRKMTEAAIHCRKVMEKCSISTSKCYDFLVTCSGGYQFVGFTAKDFYNSKYKNDEAERRRSLMSGDEKDTVKWLERFTESDPGFWSIYGLDEEGKLGNIFWRDSSSLRDYARFGDVVLIDSTYKTNVYNRPLLLFVGVNHHRESVIFGTAVLSDETAETYVWALKMFKLSMADSGPPPPCVLTDGDEPMHKAVVAEFPKSRHRLCAWHVMKNVKEKIRDHERYREFKRCMYWSMSIGQFEETWRGMVQKMEETQGGVSLNLKAWLDSMYQKRERWGEAYFAGCFFAMFKSTQCVEGLKKHLKSGLTSCSRISQILENIGFALERMRSKVVEDDYDTFKGTPVLTTHMEEMEKKLAGKLTLHIYKLAKENIDKEKCFTLKCQPIPLGDRTVFRLKQYGKDKDWEWIVELDAGGDLKCSCRLFESDGIPCRHIFCVIKTHDILELPDSLIHPRWCKADNEDYSKSDNLHFGVDSLLQNKRFVALQVIAQRICFDASLSGDAYRKVFSEFAKLANEVRCYRTEDNVRNIQDRRTVIRDPDPHKSRNGKNAEAKYASENLSSSGVKCTVCNGEGHTKRSCKVSKEDLAKKFYIDALSRAAAAQEAVATTASEYAVELGGSHRYPEYDSEYPEEEFYGTAGITQTQ